MQVDARELNTRECKIILYEKVAITHEGHLTQAGTHLTSTHVKNSYTQQECMFLSEHSCEGINLRRSGTVST